MEDRAVSKANEIINAFGWKYARMLCIEMNLEYFAFPNEERKEFWKLVTQEVDRQSL